VRRRGREPRVSPLAVADAEAPRIGDLPMKRIPVIAAHLPISAARKVAALKRIALLLVELDDQIVGVVEETVLAGADDDTLTAKAMRPLGPGLRPSMSVAEAREAFVRARATVLPVIAGGFVLGAVGRAEVERAKPRAT
jgi:CBS domain-containing protein